MKDRSWVEQSAQQPAPKIGAGHAQAMLRQGGKELAQFLPAFNNGQHVVEEPGLFGNLTPGEVAQGKQENVVMDANQEPARQQARGRSR